MLAALERLTLTATRALSVVGLIALMGLATMTLADGLLRWLASRPIEGVRDLGGLAIAVAIACCIPVGLMERGNIAIRLGAILSTVRRSDAVLITDVRGNWAATWIMAVARAGVMEPFANHAFQPRAVVRRTDLAQAVARLLVRVAPQRP